MRVIAAAVSIGLATSAGSLAAQRLPRTVAAADSAFAAGNFALAESLYYVGARQSPRDPAVREGLGRFLAAQGRTKVAIVLLEEARMFGGDPARIAGLLVPLYAHLGEWRALQILPASPLSFAERRRAAWLAEHPFGITGEGGATSIVGTPKGDTIARVAVRIGGRGAVAAIVGGDVGFIVGSRIAGSSARRFERDSTIVVLDSVMLGPMKLVNVPASIGPQASTLVIGAASLARMVVQVDYGRNRIALTRGDGGAAESRYLLIRDGGQLRVLDRGRWVALADFAAAVARASRTMVLDFARGEARIRR
ncbi:MAG TPA: tetratricopeptide repeat protein [Gemmatimonadaceae bacterium]|nr:tetratricopeptide repeat protein [Gemmatimonadaceae bacterium]